MCASNSKICITVNIESFSLKDLKNFYKGLSFFLTNKFFLISDVLTISEVDKSISSFEVVKYQHCVKKHIFSTTVFFLPNKVLKYTLNKSPHINKKAREQFETRIHKATIAVKPLVFFSDKNFLILVYSIKKFFKASNLTGMLRSKITIKFTNFDHFFHKVSRPFCLK